MGVASVQAVAELQIQGVTPDALSTSDLRLGDGGGWGAGDRGSSDLEIAGPCWRSIKIWGPLPLQRLGR